MKKCYKIRKYCRQIICCRLFITSLYSLHSVKQVGGFSIEVLNVCWRLNLLKCISFYVFLTVLKLCWDICFISFFPAELVSFFFSVRRLTGNNNKDIKIQKISWLWWRVCVWQCCLAPSRGLYLLLVAGLPCNSGTLEVHKRNDSPQHVCHWNYWELLLCSLLLP